MMQTSITVAMLLLLLLVMDVAKVGPQTTSAAVANSPAAEWGRYSLQRTSRGFRLGGADRFSHGFGRRRRVDDAGINPLS